MPNYTTISAGSSASISLASGSTLRLQGLGTAQIAPPGVPGTDNAQRTIAGGDLSFGPYASACTVNVVASANGAGVRYFAMAAGDAVPPGAGQSGAGPLSADSLQALVSKAGNTSRLLMLGNSVTGQARPIVSGETYTAGNWTPGQAVTLGQTINPPTLDLTAGMPYRKFQCVTAGVMGAAEPLWPSTVGATVTDGTVVWQCVATTNTSSTWTLSWWSIAQALAGQPLDEQYIIGQSGRQSDTILATLTDGRIDWSKVDVVYFANIFENDCWPSAAPSLATVAARFVAYQAAVDYVRITLQKRVIVQTLLPSGNIDTSGGGFTGYARGAGTKAWVWLNAKIRELARARQDVVLFEPDLLYVDPTPANGAGAWPENTVQYVGQTTGTGQNARKTDGIHPQMAAHWIIGSALATILRAKFLAPARFGAPSSEQALSVNPLKAQGTGGTNGTNISGTTAQGYTTNAFATTGTGTASLVARTDISGNWQRVAYSATVAADGANCNVTAATGLGTFAVGDVVQGFFEQRILANPVQMTSFNNILRFGGAGASYDASCGGLAVATEQDIGQFITADTAFVWKTPPVAAPAGTTGFSTYPKVVGRGVASFSVDFGRESIQRQAVAALA